MRSRVTYDNSAGYLKIVIRNKKMWWPLTFLPIWIVGWGLGGSSQLIQILNGKGTSFSMVFLVIWAISLLVAIYIWVWIALGKEVILIQNGVLTMRHDILGFGPTKTFNLLNTTNLGPNETFKHDKASFFRSNNISSLNMFAWHSPDCAITFFYQGLKCGFGIELENIEVDRLMKELRINLPSLTFVRTKDLTSRQHFGFTVGGWLYLLFVPLLTILVWFFFFLLPLSYLGFPNSLLGWLAFTVFWAFMFYWLASILHRFTPVTLGPEGMWIRVFLNRRFIPWSDVIRLAHGRFGYYSIYVKYPNPVHRTLALPFGQWFFIFFGMANMDMLFWEIYRRASYAQGHAIPVKGWKWDLPKLDLPPAKN